MIIIERVPFSVSGVTMIMTSSVSRMIDTAKFGIRL